MAEARIQLLAQAAFLHQAATEGLTGKLDEAVMGSASTLRSLADDLLRAVQTEDRTPVEAGSAPASNSGTAPGEDAAPHFSIIRARDGRRFINVPLELLGVEGTMETVEALAREAKSDPEAFQEKNCEVEGAAGAGRAFSTPTPSVGAEAEGWVDDR
ncbi:MAG: hypothetical protein AAFX81_01815 [Pseudomonadota bacterium]